MFTSLKQEMVRMNWTETVLVSMNAGILALFYTLFGVIISIGLHTVFGECDAKWKKLDLAYKIGDVSLEIIILAIIAVWSEYIVVLSPPFFHVRKELDLLVDNYISGIFYLYAIFLFMDSINDKIKDIWNSYDTPRKTE